MPDFFAGKPAVLMGKETPLTADFRCEFRVHAARQTQPVFFFSAALISVRRTWFATRSDQNWDLKRNRPEGSSLLSSSNEGSHIRQVPEQLVSCFRRFSKNPVVPFEQETLIYRIPQCGARCIL